MEIKALINNSAEQVAHGVELVGDAGDALMSMLGRFGEASEMMKSIATAFAEQAASLKEVNTAMTQLDQVTQNNAAMVTQSAAATAQLNMQAARMSDYTGRFSIESQENEDTISKVA